jgi:ankyrin repeat protein
MQQMKGSWIALFPTLLIFGCATATSEIVSAARSGDVARIEALVQRGMSPNEWGPGRQTPLMAAAEAGQLGSVRILLERGAEVNRTDWQGESALIKAARYGHAEVAVLLMEQGADPNLKPYGDRPGGFTQLLSVDSGVRPWFGKREEFPYENDPWRSGGNTALMEASLNGHIETVKVLLAHGAIVDLMNWNGESALSLARDGNHEEVKRLLREAGASD